MAIVMFATLCDDCGRRSHEYEAWPTCTDCGRDICDRCAVEDSITDVDLDAPARCVCLACEKEGAELEVDHHVPHVLEDENGDDRS